MRVFEKVCVIREILDIFLKVFIKSLKFLK